MRTKTSLERLGFDHIRCPAYAGRWILLRKEVIQPQVPLRLPCYDFTPIAGRTVGSCLPKVSALT